MVGVKKAQISKIENSTTDARFETILKVFKALNAKVSFNVELLNEHLNEILKSPDVVEKLATFGAQPAGGAPAVLARTNAQDYEVMGKIIKDLGITAE